MTIADGGLRRIVQKHLPKEAGWLWTPVETAATHQGVPDSHWAHEPSRTSGWIEHKATDGWVVTVRPHQIGWMERHCRAGVHCLILIRARGVASARGVGDSLWVINGHFIRELAQGGLGDLPPGAVLGYWKGSPREWNWVRLADIITCKRPADGGANIVTRHFDIRA